jgi:leader peptidase (prepilin peptidase)/N-methyltransferase
MFASTGEAVLGAILGYMCLWVIYWLFKLTTGKEGMGYGDFKLCAAMGAWLGWKLIPLLILLASSTAALIGICGILFAGREKGLPMAFGPYLCLSGWIALHWGDSIVSWYLSLITA